MNVNRLNESDHYLFTFVHSQLVFSCNISFVLSEFLMQLVVCGCCI